MYVSMPMEFSYFLCVNILVIIQNKYPGKTEILQPLLHSLSSWDNFESVINIVYMERKQQNFKFNRTEI